MSPTDEVFQRIAPSEHKGLSARNTPRGPTDVNFWVVTGYASAHDGYLFVASRRTVCRICITEGTC